MAIANNRGGATMTLEDKYDMTIEYRCQSCGEVDNVTAMVPVFWDSEHQEWLPDSNDISVAGCRCLECNSWDVNRASVSTPKSWGVNKASTSIPNQQDAQS